MLAAPKIFFAVGKAYEDYGSFEGAMQMYSHVLSGFPSWESRPQVALRAGAMCLHPKVNALDQAVQYFEFLLDNPPAPYTAAQVQFVLAGLYQRQGRVNLAKDVYADCLKKERESRKKEIMKRKQERAESAMMARTTENKTSEQSTGVSRVDRKEHLRQIAHPYPHCPNLTCGCKILKFGESAPGFISG